ncbi:MauE/DoxX family redox-associated membrane protein [Sphingobacterium prati]|uniref:MauE/DoxX family redox-associated membrane protein n=1 Tax=Sphingobacterium prati TaxID=2737006 RepID=UPI0015554BDC|nr:MauE/DoxX family redox-associated membrane protein [Sphingobacterium prati]NPE49432.1 DoxX family membrane protein [Sphingobacterium prati]
MKILKNIVCVLFGLLFMNAGLDKILHYMPIPPMDMDMQKVFEAFGTIKWLLPLVGVIEIIGGLLFLLPKTRTVGALVILPILIGIFTHNMVFYSQQGLVIWAVLFIIWLWVVFENWGKYKKLMA